MELIPAALAIEEALEVLEVSTTMKIILLAIEKLRQVKLIWKYYTLGEYPHYEKFTSNTYTHWHTASALYNDFLVLIKKGDCLHKD